MNMLLRLRSGARSLGVAAFGPAACGEVPPAGSPSTTTVLEQQGGSAPSQRRNVASSCRSSTNPSSGLFRNHRASRHRAYNARRVSARDVSSMSSASMAKIRGTLRSSYNWGSGIGPPNCGRNAGGKALLPYQELRSGDHRSTTAAASSISSSSPAASSSSRVGDGSCSASSGGSSSPRRMSTFSQRLRSRNLPWFGGRRIILCDPGGGVMRGGNQIRMKSADRRKPRYERQWNAAFGRPPARSKVQGAFNSMRLGLSQLEGNTFCEDRYAFDELYANGSSVFFVSVIDGHGGWQVAHFLERELLQQVRKRMFGEDARGKSGSYFSPHNITSDSEEKGGYFFGLGKKGSPGESTPVADAGAIQFDSIVPTAVDAQGIGRVLTEAYNEADETLKARISASVQLGFDRFVRLGACVITCAITDGHYVVANAGDCKALLCRGGKAVPLSRLHNLNMPEERERLRQERPNEKDLVQCVHAWKDPATSRLYERPGPGLEKIETACYVKGVLQPTRAFGDFALKSADLNITLGSFPGSGSKSVYARPVVNGADFSKGPYITAAPEVRIVPREAGDEFVIVASDGLYDLLSDDEIVEVARAAGNPELAAGALTEAAKLRALEELGLSAKEYESLTPGDRRDVHDDVTVGVFYLEFPDPWRQKISRVSEQLQSVCDEVLKSAGSNLKNGKGSMGMQEFSVCIADPSLEDCPLVAVSKGFERLTGYRVEDCVGRNCRFLNYGVPQEKLDNETASRLRAFTDVAVSGDPLAVAGANVAPPRWAQDVIGGGAYFLRWNRTRSGELFQNLFLLRQIWAEDRTYLIALQTKLEGDIEKVGGSILEELNASCDMLSRAITRRMTGLEQVLHPYPDHGEEPPKLKEVMRKFRKKTKSNATR